MRRIVVALLVAVAATTLLAVRLLSAEQAEEVAHAWLAPLASVAPAPDAPSDYTRPGAWLRRPGPSVLTSAPADLFFVHPTTYYGNRRHNAGPPNGAAGWRFSAITLPALTAPFDHCCEVHAPAYRQASLRAFLVADEAGRTALDTAYADVRRAFEAYLATTREDRPLVLAGHSQGAMHLQRLLAEYRDDERLYRRLVVAYLAGYPLNGDSGVPVCRNSGQVGCAVAWTTVGDSASARRWRNRVVLWDGTGYRMPDRDILVCVNPLDWQATSPGASAEAHRGGALTPFADTIHPHLVAAHCENGILRISTPRHPAFTVLTLPSADYHLMEFNLFQAEIRANVRQRLDSWSRQHCTPHCGPG